MTTTRQKKATTTGLTLKHPLATVGLMLSLAGALPAAAVQCGDTIGPNETVTLSGTLTCDNTTGGLTVVGPAKVDLTDLIIDCRDVNNDGYLPAGLHILGHKALVHGGVVSGCSYGVYVDGQGNHTVEDVEVKRSEIHGFFIPSHKNILRRNYALLGRASGFVTGDHSNQNTLIENTATSNRVGFTVEGNKHQLRQNSAISNDEDGFRLYGEAHRLTENVATGNIGEGFDVEEGTNNITLYRNRALQSGNGDGFEISGQRHKLKRNEAYSNWRNGIDVHTAHNIVLKHNEVLNNNGPLSATLFDMRDQTPNCDTNIWKKNTFDTASQLCIQ